ncbi:TonB-dependent receptor [Mucilaginibacter gilvus]|uniref:TonB-dependent receptor n=2 Tax=Mucilaginibacter gilvus TaxID=2305909 RepID=A0A444MNZ1_9SPHI|nr:TonB-dependent receptor [Mucilaginibacter gilvus]
MHAFKYIMKYIFLLLTILSLSSLRSNAQVSRPLSGTIIDSTKLTLPGSNVKISSELGDSLASTTDVNGKFLFPAIKGTKITLTISSIGYQGIIKHYTLPADGKAVVLDPIVLKSETRQLGVVTIVGVNPVVFKEDTVQYSVAAYKVRENAPIEDVLKKIPGLDVAKDGTVTAQGKQVTKVRVNGKDFFGGDVLSATKNLPADVIESVQIVDDYGDQANLTGVKTGEPNKVLNFTIRKDKNYGYFGQATAGDGSDLLPKNPGVTNDSRYLGLLNFFKFKGDQQVSVLGSINNTNVNTFSFGTPTGGAAGGGGFGGGGGGGGRGNALRGGSNGSTTNANGITNAHSIGLNFRDQWGKTLSVYGSYSFNDNTVFTNSTTLQTNASANTVSQSNSLSNETNNPVNHRFNFNLEWKPDTVNYLKLTPTFSYSGSDVTSFDNVNSTRDGIVAQSYTANSISNSSAPNYGITGLYNHRFNSRGRNLSIGFNGSTNKNNQYDNPIYAYAPGSLRTSPENQVIYTDSRTNAYGANLSYQEPLSKHSFLEGNYAFNHSYTSSNKETDTLYAPGAYHNYELWSNNYNYTFTTNRFGLNYRVVQAKYNYVIGIGGQPATLEGFNVKTNQSTKVNTFNVIPTARFVYNFSRSQNLSFQYNGTSNQPAFNQLQPVIDFSNASYPVLGNPNLSPEFNNSLQLRYGNFSFQTGNIFFANVGYTQTDNKIVNVNIVHPRSFTNAALAADPTLKNLVGSNLIKYQNASGYYQVNGGLVYSKPWSERKYTVIFNTNVGYTNNIGFAGSVDENNVASAIDKNIAKTFTLSPGLRFRVNITDVIDAELNSSYAVNKTDNSLNTALFNQNTNIRTLNLGASGKNYFWKDWTLSYDYNKTFNYGYSEELQIKNPNILNTYVERRFLKDHRGTLRFAAYDLFNENTGFSTVTTGSTVTQTNVNKLGRYFLVSFTLRLQKFSGKAPAADSGRGFRGDGGGTGGGGRPPGGGRPDGPM